ncbi:class I lanthipeptide [Spirosoma oryzicola]|uniref:class I lanthipeptide n=1 Tax=Spirosoma oryzicola TaxID=2898794 RepID=UPI001E512C50|nr:class I lanthipeptide [Spirosoma oryzicola]UHG94930.1 class I lanthipeptide [Spirosoma oryzicola]
MKKKIELGNKLALDKETISRLDEAQLKALVGGATVQSASCNQPAAVEGASDEDDKLEWDSCCNNSCNTKAA